MASQQPKSAPKATKPSAPRVPTSTGFSLDAESWFAYWIDAVQRTAIFWDTLRERGNVYLEHQNQGTPPLLKFDYDVVMDGRDMPRPCNYALLRLIAPPGMKTNLKLRPVIVVDPRAGHGPGIGGFKFDSEVGVAMRAGHAVYFITFRQQPENKQTLYGVMLAEARFMEEVIARHPDCPQRPVVIGNCQAGWAMMALNALRPDLFGPIMVIGSPLSYWAGGEKLNPMRYSGALLGGSWLASFAGDVGADRFDGAHLVENFERLNPANTYWNKYYNLWRKVDTEAERFLEFERWWGGFFRMTGREIEAIVENLFVGNRLARGAIKAGNQTIDLRNITSPIVVFASWGDNITPPPQALNWIIDTWGNERAIAAAGRTIIYVLHETVGHLGIFVGGEIARKEHDQLVTSLDMIESLPPGLYEMVLEPKIGKENLRWEQLEPGDFTVHYEHRTIGDIKKLNPEGRNDEAFLATAGRVSEWNASLYKNAIRPWVRLFASRTLADAHTHCHPLRLQRAMLSDKNPLANFIREQAQWSRANRQVVSDHHPLKKVEFAFAEQISRQLNEFRDRRDRAIVNWVRLTFGQLGWGRLFKPGSSDEEIAAARAEYQLREARKSALTRVNVGGFSEAVCRIVLAGMASIGSFERRSFRLARLISQLPSSTLNGATSHANWIKLLKEQAGLTAVAPVETLNALEHLLPDTQSRERALAVAAAVMMIEPTLANPRSEIIEYLIGTLQVNPQRVISLARQLTHPIEGKPVMANAGLMPNKRKPAIATRLKRTSQKSAATQSARNRKKPS